jgi:hypothetical protein
MKLLRSWLPRYVNDNLHLHISARVDCPQCIKKEEMKKPIAAQQARSRESLGRLLKAAAEILQEEGLEGATIPRIVARAGLSPGAVYRAAANGGAYDHAAE